MSYSRLSTILIKNGFEVDSINSIFSVIQTDFAQLFDLPSLEFEAGESLNSDMSSPHFKHLRFFTSVFEHVNRLKGENKFESKEDISKLVVVALNDYQYARNPDIKNDPLYSMHVQRTAAKTNSTQQPGYVEKLITGNLKKFDSFTMLDMLRCKESLKRQFSIANPESTMPSVKMMGVKHISQDEMNSADYVLVNLAKDSQQAERWGLLFKKDGETIFYSDFSLLESDKKLIEDKINGVQFESDNKHDSSFSGFSTIAKLYQSVGIDKFPQGMDPWQLRSSVLMQLFYNADALGSCCYISRDITVTDEFEHYLNQEGLSGVAAQHTGYTLQTGYIGFHALSIKKLSELSDIQENDYHNHDIQQALLANKEIAVQDLWKKIETTARLNIPAFSNTLEKVGIVKTNANMHEMNFTVDIVNEALIKAIIDTHSELCQAQKIDVRFLKNIVRKIPSEEEYGTFVYSDKLHYLYQFPPEDFAAAGLLTLFRNLTNTKTINLMVNSDYKLNDIEINTILSMISANHYLTDIHVNSGHQTVQSIAERSLPVLARNRWLLQHPYLPDLSRNHWEAAAKYWMQYLYLHPNLSETISSPKAQEFKDTITQMGIQGLDHFLYYLNNHKNVIEIMLGKNQPDFPALYGINNSDEVSQYIGKLSEYINKDDNYFPFAKVALDYQTGCDNNLLHLFSKLNLRPGIDQMVLNGVLKSPSHSIEFIKNLYKEAINYKATCLVVIPELENKESLDPQFVELRNQYSILNDVILNNRRERQFKDAKIKLKNEKQPKTDIAIAPIEITFNKSKDKLSASKQNEGKVWPLERQVSLQFQMQQQLQHSVQLHQQQKQTIQKMDDTALEGKLINYANINDIQQKALFKQFIGANPDKIAPHVIYQMTTDAFQQLVDHEKYFKDGIDVLPPLPKGFYTQRDKDNNLVLCYSMERDYVQAKTPYTIDYSIKPTPPEYWRGSVAQLLLNDDKGVSFEEVIDGELTQKAIDYLLLFNQLQIHNQDDINNEFSQFIKNHEQYKDLLNNNEDFIKRNWAAFLQVWQYSKNNDTAIHAFISSSDLFNKGLDENKSYEYLLGRNYFDANEDILSEFNQTHLKAFGQIYYQHGREVLQDFILKLKPLKNALGGQFKHFVQSFILPSKNLNELMTEESIFSINEMISFFSDKRMSHTYANIWIEGVDKHIQSYEWESLPSLWNAYKEFVRKLSAQGLHINPEVIRKCNMHNVITFMGRIDRILDKLVSDQQKQLFLDQLDKYDLKHGGVHYAVIFDNYKNIQPDLKFSDFEDGTPTYALNLATIYDNEWSTLQKKRVLSHITALNTDETRTLEDYLASKNGKHLLVLLKTTDHVNMPIQHVIKLMNAIDDKEIEDLSHYLHQKILIEHQQAEISLPMILNLLQDKNIKLFDYLNSTFYTDLSILEIFSKIGGNKLLLNNAIQLLDHINSDKITINKKAFPALQLACHIGLNIDNFDKLYQLLNQLGLDSREEIELLIKQLITIDEGQLLDQYFNKIYDCVNAMAMERDATNRIHLRERLMEDLRSTGIDFKVTSKGDYQKISDKDLDNKLSAISPLNNRLKNLLLNHVMISTNPDQANNDINHLINILTRFNHSRVEINECEHILIALENKVKGKQGYWTLSYLNGLIDSVIDDKFESTFPFSIFKEIMAHPLSDLQDIAQLKENTPPIRNAINDILSKDHFNKDEKTKLSKIYISLYSENNLSTYKVINQILDKNKKYKNDILEYLTNDKVNRSIEDRTQNIRAILFSANKLKELAQAQFVNQWMKLFSEDYSKYSHIFDKIFNFKSSKKPYILHILSRIFPINANEERKLSKLIDKLKSKSINIVNIKALSKLCESNVRPNLDQIRRIIKDREANNHQDYKLAIDAWKRNPKPSIREDYGRLTPSRQIDLERMMEELFIKGPDENISYDKFNNLLNTLYKIKSYEAGEHQFNVNGKMWSVVDMTLEEIQESFTKTKDLAEQLALLFESLKKTTDMYPNLAQQIALLADVMLPANKKRILQFATGEGKSNVIALRSAYLALTKNQPIDIVVAKNYLAERDQKLYDDFYQSFGLKSHHLEHSSSKEDIEKANICYFNMGEFSICKDILQWKGTPLKWNKDRRIALIDEFDEVVLEESKSMQYQYGTAFGRSPKEMQWAYDAANKFYDHHFQGKNLKEINEYDLSEFIKTLVQHAEGLQSRLKLIEEIISDENIAISWIQAAHKAYDFSSKKGDEFTIKALPVLISGEVHILDQVVPLSRTDKQPLIGSIYKDRMHQLLVSRLMTNTKVNGETVQIYLPPESNSITAQTSLDRIRESWSYYEGYTATVSSFQTKQLYANAEISVIDMPTNLPTRRQWNEPIIVENDEQYKKKLFDLIRRYMDKNESVLITCRDDVEVEKFQRYLKEYEAQIVAVKSSDTRSNVEVLEEKKQKEHISNGKKSKGVILISSGMGRGDNLDVSGVIIPYVTNENNKLQKGGRTARFGEFGTVDELLMQSEVEEEYGRTFEFVMNLSLSKDKNNNKSITPLEKMQFIREYSEIIDEVTLEETRKHHSYLSQYSSWGMEIVSRFYPPNVPLDNVHEMHNMWVNQMSYLQEKWGELSLSNNQKRLDEFENSINTCVNNIIKLCSNYNLNVSDFKLEKNLIVNSHYLPNISLEKSRIETKTKLRIENKIRYKLYSLHIHEDKTINSTIDQLNDGQKRYLSDEIVDINDKATFIMKLKQVSKMQQNKLNTHSYPLNDLSPSHSIHQKLRFLSDTLIDKISHHITPSDFDNPTSAIGHLLDYINKVPANIRDKIGAEYIDHYARLRNATDNGHDQLWAARLSLPTMPLNEFERIYQIVTAHSKSTNEKINLLQAIKNAIKGEPVTIDCIRQLMKAENFHDETFFMNVLNVMKSLKAEDIDVLDSLLKVSEHYWALGNGKYQDEVKSTWQLLSTKAHENDFTSLIKECLKITKGKEIFQILSLLLKMDVPLIETDMKVLKTIYESNISKKDKHNILKLYIRAFPESRDTDLAHIYMNSEFALKYLTILGDIKSSANKNMFIKHVNLMESLLKKKIDITLIGKLINDSDLSHYSNSLQKTIFQSIKTDLQIKRINQTLSFYGERIRTIDAAKKIILEYIIKLSSSIDSDAVRMSMIDSIIQTTSKFEMWFAKYRPIPTKQYSTLVKSYLKLCDKFKDTFRMEFFLSNNFNLFQNHPQLMCAVLKWFDKSIDGISIKLAQEIADLILHKLPFIHKPNASDTDIINLFEELGRVAIYNLYDKSISIDSSFSDDDKGKGIDKMPLDNSTVEPNLANFQEFLTQLSLNDNVKSFTHIVENGLMSNLYRIWEANQHMPFATNLVNILTSEIHQSNTKMMKPFSDIEHSLTNNAKRADRIVTLGLLLNDTLSQSSDNTQAIYDLYNQCTTSILKPRTKETTKSSYDSKDRGLLNLNQYKQMLAISSELKEAQSYSVCNKVKMKVKSAHFDTVKTKITDMLSKYRNESWLSEDRKNQYEKLKTDMETNKNYFTLLTTLNDAKESAMQLDAIRNGTWYTKIVQVDECPASLQPNTLYYSIADESILIYRTINGVKQTKASNLGKIDSVTMESLRENESNKMTVDYLTHLSGDTNFFKTNKRGYSRYLNTIEQMKEQVLQSWLSDAKSFNNFGLYKEYLKSELDNMITHATTLLQYVDNKQLQPLKNLLTQPREKGGIQPGLEKGGSLMLFSSTTNIDPDDKIKNLSESKYYKALQEHIHLLKNKSIPGEIKASLTELETVLDRWIEYQSISSKLQKKVVINPKLGI